MRDLSKIKFDKDIPLSSPSAIVVFFAAIFCISLPSPEVLSASSSAVSAPSPKVSSPSSSAVSVSSPSSLRSQCRFRRLQAGNGAIGVVLVAAGEGGAGCLRRDVIIQFLKDMCKKPGIDCTNLLSTFTGSGAGVFSSSDLGAGAEARAVEDTKESRPSEAFWCLYLRGKVVKSFWCLLALIIHELSVLATLVKNKVVPDPRFKIEIT
ncbi:uncharacterized protein DS421_2g48020 [Arachis hypogaea]|nr:uncharacterized protein DS421_2g48020 [Arachis hypogaea]